MVSSWGWGESTDLFVQSTEASRGGVVVCQVILSPAGLAIKILKTFLPKDGQDGQGGGLVSAVQGTNRAGRGK